MTPQRDTHDACGAAIVGWQVRFDHLSTDHTALRGAAVRVCQTVDAPWWHRGRERRDALRNLAVVLDVYRD